MSYAWAKDPAECPYYCEECGAETAGEDELCSNCRNEKENNGESEEE